MYELRVLIQFKQVQVQVQFKQVQWIFAESPFLSNVSFWNIELYRFSNNDLND